jgi:hypothetical protein
MILFLATRLLTKAFWLLVLSTFLGVLMITMRNFYRNAIFQDAAREAQPSRFFNANRF